MQSTQGWEYTKIVSTIGPASDSEEELEALILAGVNVARLNTKHGSTQWHAERIDRIRKAANKVGKPVAILLDLQGPEIRIDLHNKQPLQLKEGDQVHFVSEFTDDLKNQIRIPQNVIESLGVDNRISIDDGTCEMEITEKLADHLVARTLSNCICGDRKTMNTPGIIIDMPSLIPADLEKLDILKDHSVDFIALSFVRNKVDIAILRDEMKKRGITADLVAKIENQSAIDHLNEIIEHSDAVMVARGDLGVEAPMEELAFLQKEIIKRCRAYGKPVITATQMLKSMVENARPTRAEVCDVANAVFDGTDAVMLSEETAMGKFPMETVTIMRKIVNYNETKVIVPGIEEESKSMTSAVTKMAMSLVEDKIASVDKILVLTETGFTAQQMTRHRPHVPLIVVTDRHDTVLRSTLLFGALPIFHEFPVGKIMDLSVLINRLKDERVVQKGQKLLVVHGTIYKTPGFTNAVAIIDVE